ncbi:MAG: DUF2344 domain-containing protein [Clostridia bacterium]|nr:DUF2344 domain-containing protein [Clostridia bacterium]
MKSVRIWFKKDGATRYISHLDLNRVMTRALQHSRLPIWHTEGFNPHPFLTFALPLSLGFRGVNECMDIKLTENNICEKEIIDKLNVSLPVGIRIFKVTDPIMKAGKITYAKFNMKMTCNTITLEELFFLFRNLFARETIEIEKKNKKGVVKTLDLKPDIGEYTLEKTNNDVTLKIVLSAGSVQNVNPTLLIAILEKENNIEINYDITRLDLYNEEMKAFV